MASKGLIGLIRRGCHEIPDVMASFALGGGSLLLLGAYLYKEYRDGTDYQYNMYRYNYTVKRPEDVKDKEVHPDLYN